MNTQNKKAYLHFGGAACGMPQGPFQTIGVEYRETELPQHGRTVAGYGCRIPSHYMVKWAGRWRRVYVCNYGNSGTAYIGRNFGTTETIATVHIC